MSENKQLPLDDLGYEPWRPAYESYTIIGWTLALIWCLWLFISGAVHGALILCALVFSAAMLSLRVIGTWRILLRRAALSGCAQSFMSLRDLQGLMKKHPEELWLGLGFLWCPVHSQRLYELLKLDYRTLRLPAWLAHMLTGRKPLSEKEAGLCVLHGLSTQESNVYRTLKNFEGGLCICGTTQAGKGVYLTQLVSQAVLRGDVVIVIDPKHSPRLKNSLLRACQAADRPVPLTFHPAYPDQSIRLDPLYSFTNPSEIASRLRDALPPGTDENFASFAWMAVNAVVVGLIALQRRPNLMLIARYIRLGIEDLLQENLNRYCRSFADSGWMQRLPELAKHYGKSPDGADSELLGKIVLYESILSKEHPDEAVETLIEVFRHDKAHYSKITASLLPILSMLAGGTLQKTLSPDPTDWQDERPIMNLEKVIQGRHVLYIGMDSLSDTQVSSTLASIWLSDLANVAGRRYNLGQSGNTSVRISLFVDELAEVINPALIQILNKGAESGIYTTCAMQTVADIARRLGSEHDAQVALANFNNLIALRTRDAMTQRYISATLGRNYVANQSVTHTTRSDGTLSDSAGHVSRSLNSQLQELFPTEFLGRLPNCEALIQVSGGYIYKMRCPILTERKEHA